MTELEDLHQRRIELINSIQGIETQLADDNVSVNGTRLSGKDWREWRRRAIRARAERLKELRHINSLLGEQKPGKYDEIIRRLDSLEEKIDLLLEETEE